MCALCCAPSYTERPEICAEMCSEFALFQSCLLGHSCPLVRAPLQGHRYCPLAKSVRPSLTQIRFLPKWDFYCSIRAGSRISLPQPFPVSSRRGSAALLQFFFFFFPSPFLPPPSPASSPRTNLEHRLQKRCLCRPSLDFKEWKEFLKKKRDTLPSSASFYTSSHTNTGSNIHTDFASYILMCTLWAISLVGVCVGVWSPATPKRSFPMAPQHVASFVIAEKIVLCMQGVSDHTFGQRRPSNEQRQKS